MISSSFSASSPPQIGHCSNGIMGFISSSENQSIVEGPGDTQL